MKKIILAMSICASLAACGSQNASTAGKEVEILNYDDNGDFPFSDAARVGKLLFLSGALGIAPGQGQLVPGGITEETRQVMENIKRHTEASGYQMKDIVKCSVFLADMAEWSAFNAVYGSYFSKPYPGRIAVGVNGLALGARVEVECIAAK